MICAHATKIGVQRFKRRRLRGGLDRPRILVGGCTTFVRVHGYQSWAPVHGGGGLRGPGFWREHDIPSVQRERSTAQALN